MPEGYRIHLAGLLDAIDVFDTKYNVLPTTGGSDKKHHLGEAQMFIIEGMEQVREVIEKPHKRKSASKRDSPLLIPEENRVLR